MTQTIAILGRQPALGVAELESLFGATQLRSIADNIVLIDKPAADIAISRLGGTVKLARVLARLEATAWPRLVADLTKTLPEYVQDIPEGKIRLGLNSFGTSATVAEINRAGLQFKKVIKNMGRSVRVVPNSSLQLNSAQTLHNQLSGQTGLELVLVKDGGTTLVGQVVAVQDISAYAARDQARPKRDARVGMLPPKLAQIIINLAVNGIDSADTNRPHRLLDPFCGTGVILQEALLMGYDTYGTDLEARMIEYSQTNLEWLTKKLSIAGDFTLAKGDAAHFTWEEPVDLIAGETYLGRPFSALPDRRVLDEVMRDVDTIHRKFLRNVARQTQPGFRMCIAVPAWKTPNGFLHLKTLASVEELGYTRISFVHAGNEELVYHRENQVVGRELVVLTRK